jgi:hypothetical protein
MNRVGLQCEADVGKGGGWKDRARTMQQSLTDAAQQLICNRQVVGSNPSAFNLNDLRRFGMRNSTPFFAAFGPLLFGRAPRSRLQELLGQWSQMPSINQYMEAFGEFIPQTLLGRSKEKVNSRQRIFSPWLPSGPFWLKS